MAEKKKAKAKKTTTKKKTTRKVVVKETPALDIDSSSVTVESAQETVAPREVVTHKKTKKAKLPPGLRYYGTGRRKEAIAKVWLKPGSGQFNINGKSLTEYFCNRKVLEFQVARPLVITNTQLNYDVFAEAYGGGVPGQAGAISLGISRALLEVSPDFRVKLKREGFLTRDPRTKERKKYGHKRARKSFQYTKR